MRTAATEASAFSREGLRSRYVAVMSSEVMVGMLKHNVLTDWLKVFRLCLCKPCSHGHNRSNKSINISINTRRTPGFDILMLMSSRPHKLINLSSVHAYAWRGLYTLVNMKSPSNRLSFQWGAHVRAVSGWLLHSRVWLKREPANRLI